MSFNALFGMNGHENRFRYQCRFIFFRRTLGRTFARCRFYVSVITEIELLSYPLLTAEEENAIHDFLADVTIEDLTQSIKHAAIALRQQYRFKLPDALIVATAQCLNADLLTNDIKLLKIEALSTKPLRLND